MSSSSSQTLQEKYTSSIQLVRGKAQQLEKELLVPSVDRGKELGRTYPVSATFITVFFVLSIIPVLSFAAFLAFATISTVFVATTLIFSFVLGAIVFGSFFLVPTLILTFNLALISTTSLLSAYLAYRLWIALKSSPTLPLAFSQLKTDFLTLIANELSVAQSTLGRTTTSVPQVNGSKSNGTEEIYLLDAGAGKKVKEVVEKIAAEGQGQQESGGEEKKVKGEGERDGVVGEEEKVAAGEF